MCVEPEPEDPGCWIGIEHGARACPLANFIEVTLQPNVPAVIPRFHYLVP